MSEINPYKPPESHVADVAAAVAGDFIPEGRAVAVGHAWDWIVAGYGLFKKQPGIWILTLIIAIALLVVLGKIPFGGLLSGVLFPVIAGGLMLGCKALDEERELTVGHLFAGFKHNTGKLLMVGAIWAVVSLLISTPIMLLAIGSAYWTILGGGTPDPALFGVRFLLAVLIIMALMLPDLHGAVVCPRAGRVKRPGTARRPENKLSRLFEERPPVRVVQRAAGRALHRGDHSIVARAAGVLSGDGELGLYGLSRHFFRRLAVAAAHR